MFRRTSYLYEDVDTGEGKEHQPCEGSGQQQNDADLQQFEQVTQHHLQPIRNHAINCVDFFGEAVQQVSAGRDLKEGHGWVQDTVEKIGVKVTRCYNTTQSNGKCRPKHGHPWNTDDEVTERPQAGFYGIVSHRVHRHITKNGTYKTCIYSSKALMSKLQWIMAFMVFPQNNLLCSSCEPLCSSEPLWGYCEEAQIRLHSLRSFPHWHPMDKDMVN